MSASVTDESNWFEAIRDQLVPGRSLYTAIDGLPEADRAAARAAEQTIQCQELRRLSDVHHGSTVDDYTRPAGAAAIAVVACFALSPKLAGLVVFGAAAYAGAPDRGAERSRKAGLDGTIVVINEARLARLDEIQSRANPQ